MFDTKILRPGPLKLSAVEERTKPKRYELFPTLLRQESPYLPPNTPLIIDLFVPDVVFGDNIVRTGMVNFLRSRAKSTVVLTNYPFLYHDQTGIIQPDASVYEKKYTKGYPDYSTNPEQYEADKKSLAALIDQTGDIPYIVLPPDRSVWKLALWQDVFEERHQQKKPMPKVILDLMNNSFIIEQNDFERERFPQLNRITLAFASQLKRKTLTEFEPSDFMPKTEITSFQRQLASRYLEASGITHQDIIIGIADYASVDYKRWDKFPQLLVQLTAMFPQVYFAMLDPNTFFTAEMIHELPNEVSEKIIYSPKVDGFGIQPGIVERADLFIGNDSGTGHYFSSVNFGSKPSFSLFNKRDNPDRWAPCGYLTEFLYSDAAGNIIDRKQYSNQSWEEARDTLVNDGNVNIQVNDVIKKTREPILELVIAKGNTLSRRRTSRVG